MIELIIGLVALWIVVGPFILWRIERRRRLEEQNKSQDQLQDLTSRIFHLESSIESLKKSAAAPAPDVATQASVVAAQAVEEKASKASAQQSSPLIEHSRTVSKAEAVAEEWVRTSRVPERVETAKAAEIQKTSPPPPPLFTRQQEHIAKAQPASALSERMRASLSLEETLGTNWLNKLGIIILVLGISFFLAYQLKTMGPAGKVVIGYVASIVLLGVGLWMERRESYRLLARAGMAGGWALLFFTTYAMYHVPAARVLSSQSLDLVLMLAVAAGMVWHTLRYSSQVLTGLAFLMAYLTVTISHATVYSLSAGAVLAVALAVVAVRMRWFEMEICGIAASYLNHYLWLRPIIEAMHGRKHPFPEFAASAAILILYWLVYRLSYVVRKPETPEQERTSSLAALFNIALLLLLLKYQSVHPEWAFWGLLALGAAETGLAQLPTTRRRRTAVIVLSTIGITLLIAAFPFRYSGSRLSILWLAEAEALLLIGVWTKEIIFRRLGILAAVLTAGQMTSYDAARIVGMRMDDAYVHSDFRMAVMFLAATIIFYGDAHWVARRWSSLFAGEIDRILISRLSYVAAIMAFVGAWIAFPAAWTAVAWVGLTLILAFVAQRLRLKDLDVQANVISVAAVLRIFVENLSSTRTHHGLTERVITVSIVAAILYVRSKWTWERTEQSLHVGDRVYSLARVISAAYTWTATFLLSLLAWYELRSTGVAVAWGMGGLMLLEIGLRRRSFSLRLQAYVLFAAGFVRIFIVNLNAAGAAGEVSPRLYTILPLIFAFFYAYERLRGQPVLPESKNRALRAENLCYLGTITAAALMRFELESDWVAAGWSAFAIVLILISWRTQRRIFLQQALILAIAVLFRTVLHNFYQRSYFPAPVWESRWVCVGTTILLLFATLPVALTMRRRVPASDEGGKIVRLLRAAEHRPEQLFFFVALILLTVLLGLEMRHGMVTVSWGLEAVAVFLVALWLSERSFRLAGLGLLFLCVGKIIVIDVWRLNPRDRYLTFIILGCALLLVSFLYTRHREAIRQYL